jgi:two-component system sensor histidine kinase/response regulator
MPRILIVDDDPALLQALPEALTLRLAGLEIDTAGLGLAALERIRATDYEAIVCDIKMPGMDGLALLRAIRALWPDTPTLLITGHGDHDLAIQALRGGAYDFIQKPIDRDHFLASLTRAMQMRHLSRQVAEQSAALQRHTEELEQLVAERTAELRRTNEDLEALVLQRTEEVRRNERLAVAGQVAAAAAHGIRGPLGVVEDLLRRALSRAGGDTGDLQDCLDEVARMRSMLADFVLLAKPPAVSPEPVGLVPLLLDVYRVLQLRSVGRGVALRLDFAEPMRVMGDSGQLRQMLLNVGVNALEALDGEGEVEFSLRAASDRPDWAEIVVWDSGAQIAADEIPHLFEAFYRR